MTVLIPLGGQSLSFALGTCAGIALGLILCCKALFLVKHRLLQCAQSFRYLTRDMSHTALSVIPFYPHPSHRQLRLLVRLEEFFEFPLQCP